MSLLFIALFVFAFWLVGFALASIFFGAITVRHYIIARRAGRKYVPSWRLAAVWGFTAALIMVVLMACHLAPARRNRTYVSPDGRYDLRVATYNTMDIEVVRLTAKLKDRQRGKLMGEFSASLWEFFIQDSHGSEDDDSGYVVEWCESNGVVRVVVPEMNTAYTLPAGEILHPIPKDGPDADMLQPNQERPDLPSWKSFS